MTHIRTPLNQVILLALQVRRKVRQLDDAHYAEGTIDEPAVARAPVFLILPAVAEENVFEQVGVPVIQNIAVV